MTAALRDRLLVAALPHVPLDGWTLAALREGASDAGLPFTDIERAFPGGVADAVERFSRLMDERMVAALAGLDLEGMRMRERIRTAVRVRLEENAARREAMRRAVSFLLLPEHAGRGLRSLYRTVDAMWRAAGDAATDFNFYTKRALLAGVYASTLLYWFDDSSEGFEATWGFLDRRIDDVMRIPRMTGPLRRLTSCLASPLPWVVRPPSPRR